MGDFGVERPPEHLEEEGDGEGRAHGDGGNEQDGDLEDAEGEFHGGLLVEEFGEFWVVSF